MPKNRKPKKPYPDFPLGIHPNGQWCKKIRGKLHYFGTDSKAALDKYLEQRDDLQAGRIPRSKDTLTVRGLVNRFLTSKKTDLASGNITQRTWNDYHREGVRLAGHFGDQYVEDLRPEEFDAYKAKLATTRGVVAIGNSILRSRIIFNWAFQNDLIGKPIRFGTSFKQPNKTALRRSKEQSGKRTFTADELRKIVAAAGCPLKAMILLGINCGFGQTDVANLPLEAIDLAGGWVSFPRPKTAIPRRAPLWPETVKALKKAIDDRPDPAAAADAGLVFLTQRGARWVRGNEHEDGRVVFTDAVAGEFNKLLVKLQLKKRGGFYNLRHTFRTEAAAVADRDAAEVIMGHVDPSMGAVYVERFPDARLQAVVNVVRSWLWPKKRQRS